MLAPHNVTVLAARRSSEALRICGEEVVHLLIADVLMPEMDGNKLAEQVLKLYPRISVLLISGNANEAPAANEGRVRFLTKPFSQAQLVRLMREMVADKAELA